MFFHFTTYHFPSFMDMFINVTKSLLMSQGYNNAFNFSCDWLYYTIFSEKNEWKMSILESIFFLFVDYIVMSCCHTILEQKRVKTTQFKSRTLLN